MPDSKTSYKDKTYASNDPLRKFSHASRFELAASLFDVPENGRVLDFGGGDGAFLDMVRTRATHPFEAVLFEPYMEVPPNQAFVHATRWDEVNDLAADRLFDVVFCQEVMEHFAPHRQEEALERIASVMAPNGTLVLSVPVELGPVALVKNIARWKYRRNGTEIYNYPNLFRSIFALPIPEARSGDDYLTHMGFYFTDFRRVLEQRFVIKEIIGSPFSSLPLPLNSQVFFRGHPRG